MTQGLLVELCGLPGAGKSFMADDLTGALSRVGLPVHLGTAAIGPEIARQHRIPRKLLLSAAYAWDAPRDCRRVGLAMTAGGRVGFGNVAKRLVQWAVTQRLLNQARSAEGVHVFDEGVVQALWSLALRGDVGPVLARLVDGSTEWTAPDFVVAIDVPPELALERLRVRSSRHSRTQLLVADEQLLELRRGRAELARLLTWFGTVTDPANVLRITSSDHAALSAAVRCMIDRMAVGSARRSREG